MLAAGAISQLPPGHRPAVVSPLGVVPKPRSDKLRLIINMRYVNRHLVRKVFKFEGLRDLSDILEPEDWLLSYNLTSGYYHCPLRQSSKTYFGIFWDGTWYQYNCLPFGLSVAPYVFSKIMRELVIKWRGEGIATLAYLDDFLYGFRSVEEALRFRTRLELDFFRAGLRLNWEKSQRTPVQLLRHLGFMVDTAKGLFLVPTDRWEKLQKEIAFLLSRPRVQARRVSSCVGQIISMGLSMGPVTQLYTRHLYAAINSAPTLNYWVSLPEEAASELLFWSGLGSDSFTSPIWPTTAGTSIRLACDASAFGWGALTLSGQPAVAHEFFSAEEQAESSTYRELLGVYRCLLSLEHRCRDSLVVFQVDNLNLLSIVNRGSRKLPLNELARDLFWFCLRSRIQLRVEWVPREENQAADDISKMALADDWRINPVYFRWLDERWGPHSCDLFASSSSKQCERFYSKHWCPGTAGINSFAYDWSSENSWINAPFRSVGQVWRKLRSSLASATILVPLWWSATWWNLIAPDSSHLSEFVVDWVWLPRHDRELFLPSPGTGLAVRDVPPASWSVLAVRVDFSLSPSSPPLRQRDRCLYGGCRSCASRSWHRKGQ